MPRDTDPLAGGPRDAPDTPCERPDPHRAGPPAPRPASPTRTGAAPLPAPHPERAGPPDPSEPAALRATAPLTSPPAGGAPRGYRAVFAVREFRAVFAAHLLSLLGVVVSELALTVLVYELTASPLLSALTFALGMLPYLVGGTLFSGIADRYPARRVLVTCDLICAGCVAVMVLPGTPVAALLVLRCLVAAVSPVFTGTRMAALADILGEDDLYVLGRSLLRIVSQGALLAGFGVGGLLLAVVSPRGAITITVATFLGSAALLRLGTRDRPARAGGGQGGTLLRESLSGARLVLGNRRIRALLLLFWLPPAFVVAPEALAAPYADEIGAGTVALGLLMCAMPVGQIAAELYAGAVLSPRVRSLIVLPVAAVGLLPFLLYGVSPGIVPIAVALVLAGAGSAYIIGLDQWFVEAVPDELRGRAMTLLTAGLMTLQGAGMALAGLAAEFFPVHQVVAGAGALGTLCLLLLVAEVRRTAPAHHIRTEVRDGEDQHMASG
ncbi:MFS transporter [Streptomyces laculatispora]|uniref:MFS transporter n=1 Tax=Streptomyces laculatispora TaxID=887464 RepID=A0ABY9I187_9ACTN|nr:MFS transporter [Streptomyces laculatispora]WLQ40596.1 MFS transporter [Streptomyces laculatispora]